MKTQLKLALQHGFVVAAWGLFFSACQMQQPPATATESAGVYALVSVDGKPVPASVSHEGVTLNVRSGTFTIKADGTCSSRIVFVSPSGIETTREVSATYTEEGSQVNMRWKGAGKTVGTISGKTFTMNNEGMLFVYRK